MRTSTPFLPYGRQCVDDRDIAAVTEVLRGDWLTTGPTIDRFEAGLVAATSAARAVAVSSGTAALHLAYAALGVGPGDEVIVPALTFSATANAALHLGADVRFADVDPATLTVDPASVASLVSPRTRVITAVDYAGHPADYDALRPIASSCGAHLLADACHSLGASYRGRPVGSVADVSCLSFHPVKPITTGEGGAVVTHDAEVADRVARLRSHGMERGRVEADPDAGAWAYDIAELGWNYRITDLQCALGLRQLDELAGWIVRRQEIAARYRQRLAGHPYVVLPPEAPWASHGYHLFAVQVPAVRRRAVFDALRAAGIGVQVHYIPVNMLQLYRARGHRPEDTPRTLEAYRGLLSLPCYPALGDEDVDRVVDALIEAVDA